MAYTPSLYNPYGHQQFQPTTQNMNWGYQPAITQPMMQQPVQNQVPANPVMYVVPVKSFLEAKEYKEQQGAEPPLFMLENQPVFIKKEKDERGGEKFSAYRFSEIPLSDIMPNEENYVTRADLDAFANKIMEALNGKPVAQSSESAVQQAG